MTAAPPPAPAPAPAPAPGPAPLPKDRPALFDRSAIEGLIPHREPMLLLERVAWLEPGRGRIVAIASDLSRASGRAPGVPRREPGVVPPEVLVEAAAQAAAALVVAEGVAEGRHPPGEPQPGVLGGVPSFRFPAPAPEGVPISLEVEVTRRLGRLVLLAARVHAGAALAAEGTLSIAIGKPGT